MCPNSLKKDYFHNNMQIQTRFSKVIPLNCNRQHPRLFLISPAENEGVTDLGSEATLFFMLEPNRPGQTLTTADLGPKVTFCLPVITARDVVCVAVDDASVVVMVEVLILALASADTAVLAVVVAELIAKAVVVAVVFTTDVDVVQDDDSIARFLKKYAIL